MGKVIEVMLAAILIIGAFSLGSWWPKADLFKNQRAVLVPTLAPTAVPPVQAEAVPAGEELKISARDHVRGNKNAKLVIIEYGDLECPYCKQFQPTMQQVMAAYPTKVMWVYRHYPLSFHANAQKEAEAAECVGSLGGDSAFWKFIDFIYERTTSNGTGFALDNLGPLAAETGVDQTKFQTCLDSGKFTGYVNDQADGGVRLGVTGTPGNILVNTVTGKTESIPGAVSFIQIKAVIDRMLKP